MSGSFQMAALSQRKSRPFCPFAKCSQPTSVVPSFDIVYKSLKGASRRSWAVFISVANFWFKSSPVSDFNAYASYAQLFNLRGTKHGSSGFYMLQGTNHMEGSIWRGCSGGSRTQLQCFLWLWRVLPRPQLLCASVPRCHVACQSDNTPRLAHLPTAHCWQGLLSPNSSPYSHHEFKVCEMLNTKNQSKSWAALSQQPNLQSCREETFAVNNHFWQ